MIRMIRDIIRSFARCICCSAWLECILRQEIKIVLWYSSLTQLSTTVISSHFRALIQFFLNSKSYAKLGWAPGMQLKWFWLNGRFNPLLMQMKLNCHAVPSEFEPTREAVRWETQDVLGVHSHTYFANTVVICSDFMYYTSWGSYNAPEASW